MTKRELIAELIGRPSGASIDELMEATGWQRTSVHAEVRRLRRRLLLNIVSRERRYLLLGGSFQRKEPQAGTKSAKLLEMLRRRRGASAVELEVELGWDRRSLASRLGDLGYTAKRVMGRYHLVRS